MPDTPSRAVVVADAHLGQVPAAVEAAFFRFLAQVPRPGDHLVINGDLFDFWFEYEAVIPRKHFTCITQLKAVRDRGIPITFVGGNHDRWGGDFLRQDLGIDYHTGDTELMLAGRRTYVVHGDGLTEQHWSAELMHRITRNRTGIRLFRMIHPDLAFRLTRHLSKHLADSTKDRAVLDRAEAAQVEWAKALLGRRPELDLVVMAHTHRPRLEWSDGRRAYLNPGPFLEGGCYAIVTPDAIELKAFPF